MRICLLTKRYYTGKDLISDRYGRLYHLPREWVNQGAEVDVLALDYRGKEAAVHKEDGLKLCSVPSRFWDLSAVNAALEGRHYDVIVASGHLNIGHQALILGKRLGLPVVFDVYDFYPAFHPIVHPLLGIYFRWLLPQFHGAMVVSQKLESWCCAHQARLCRIPNGVHPGVFAPIDREIARKRCGFKAAGPVLGLFGSLSKNLGACEVANSFAELRKAYPEAELLLAGSGGERIAKTPGVRYLGMLGQDELTPWASCCDVLLIPYRNSLQVRYSQSARLAEYLALQRPIVVTRVGDAETWFPQGYRGLCEAADASSMLAAMIRQIQSPEVLPLNSELEWDSLGLKSLRFLKQLVGWSGEQVS